jgi:hypothetical protein
MKSRLNLRLQFIYNGLLFYLFIVVDLSKLKLGQEAIEDEVKQMPLGLEEDSKLEVGLSRFKQRFFKAEKELKFSGVFNNFWLWNIVFMHFGTACILLFIYQKYASKLPPQVGINLDNNPTLDMLIDKSSLIYFILIHLFIPLISVFFVIRARRRLDHLLALSYFNYLILLIVEFMAFKGLIFYFL